MKPHRLLIALVCLVAALITVLWFVIDPAPTALPVKGAAISGDLEPSAYTRQAAELPAPSAALQPPPEAPVVVNDARQGTIWLRLIDADSNRPIRNLDCGLWWYCLMPNGRSFFEHPDASRGQGPRAFQPSRHKPTDENGLMAHTAATVHFDDTGSYRNDPEETAEVYYDARGGQADLLLPLPPGSEPAFDGGRMYAALMGLVTTASNKPVDVAVRRRPGISGAVRDQTGHPVADAWVYAFPVQATPQTHPWAYMESPEYRRFQDHTTEVRLLSDGPRAIADSEVASLVAEFSAAQVAGWICLGNAHSLTGELSPVPFRQRDSTEPHRLRSMADGTFAFPGAYSATWVVAAFTATRGLVWQFADATGHHANVELVLGPPALGGISLHLDASKDDAPEDLTISWQQAGPWGCLDGVSGLANSVTVEWNRSQSESDIQLGGIPSGTWFLSVEEAGRTHSALVAVRPGIVAEVRLVIGSQSHARWTPWLRFGSRPVHGGQLYLCGGPFQTPEVVTIDWPDDQTGPTPLTLTCGEYVAWLPGLAPYSFTLAAGESRSDVFDIPAVSCAFSVDQRLAEQITDERLDVSLNLFGQDVFADPGFLQHLGDVLLDQDEDYDILSPGKTSMWWLPPGKYTWELEGVLRTLRGTLDVRPGSNKFHFSMDNLPGLARLNVTVPGASEEEPAELSFIGEDMSVPTVPAGGPVHVPKATKGSEAQVFTFDYGKHQIAFATPGVHTASVYQGSKYLRRPVTFPGDVTLEPKTGDWTEVAYLRLGPSNHEEFRHDGLCFESGGWCRALNRSYTQMEPGRVRVLVLRFTDSEAPRRLVGCATVEFEVAIQERKTIQLDDLVYEAPGWVNIHCTGRGDPESLIDPWWMGAHRQGPRLFLLQSLDRAVGNAPAAVQLDQPDSFFQAGKPAFAYLNRPLPPGRYRAIPWQGALEKYCRTFEVKPGATVDIAIQGG